MTLPDLNLSNVALFAMLGSVATFYRQIQSFIVRFIGVFIRRDTVQENVGRHLVLKIMKNCKVIRWGDSNWKNEMDLYLPEFDRFVPVLNRADSTLFVLYKNRIPIVLSIKTYSEVTFTYLWGTFNCKEEASEVFVDHQKKMSGKAGIYRETFRFDDIMGSESGGSTSEAYSKKASADREAKTTASIFAPAGTDADQVFFGIPWLHKYTPLLYKTRGDYLSSYPNKDTYFFWSEEAKHLKDEISYLIENYEWFKERHIKFNRGFLLTGTPGGGKSVMVREVAMALDVPLRVFSMSTLSDQEFTRSFTSNNGYNYCINLIEDIDVIFDGRDNKLNGQSMMKNLVSFDTLINCIAGVRQSSGVFTVITTNKPETLDPALKRAGRLDVHIDVGPMSEEGRRHVVKNILRDWPEIFDEMIKKTEGMMAVYVENACREYAFNRKMSEKNKL